MTFARDDTATTNNACTVSAQGAVTFGAAGICQVIASQAGDGRYEPASSVTRAFTISANTAGSPYITSLSTGDQSATVAFTAPADTGGAPITAYRVTATPRGGGPTVTTTACDPAASPLRCTITGLVNGVDYDVTVAAINAAGDGPESGSRLAEPEAAPTAVTGVAAKLQGRDLTVRWTPLTTAQLRGGNFTQYEVSYREAPSGSITSCPYDATTFAPTLPCVAAGSGAGELDVIGTDGITITDLDPTAIYDVQIVAITQNAPSQTSANSASVPTFPMTAPGAPRNAATVDVGATSAQFSWSPPASDGGEVLDSADPYTVTVTSDDTGAASPITCAWPSPRNPADTRCTASGLTNGATYTFRVSAANSKGTGPVVSATYAVPSADSTLRQLVLSSPATLTPSFDDTVTTYTATVPFSTTSVTVTPTATVSGGVITVEGVVTASGTASLPKELEVGETTITVVSTAPDPAYYSAYEVTVTRLAQPPNPSPGTPPGPPGKVRAVAGDGEATVSWTPPAQVGDFPVSDYEVQAQPGGATCLVKVPALTCTIGGLRNGTAYTFVVRAFSGAGWGAWSQPSASVTPSSDPVPGPEPVPAPPLAPGEWSLVVDAAPKPAEVTPNQGGNGLDVTAEGWTMTLAGLDAQGTPLDLGPRGVLILDAERQVRTTGKAFMPGSQVALYINPPTASAGSRRAGGQTVSLGSIPVDARGWFAGAKTLPVGLLAGEYVLQAVGTGPLGEVRAMSLGIVVRPWIVLFPGKRTSDVRHDRIRTGGDTGGLAQGERLTPHLRFDGQPDFSNGRAVIRVGADGTFTWTRLIRLNRGLTAYISYGDTASNEVFWAKVR